MRYKNPQLVAQHVSMMKKRATKTKFVAQSRPALYFRNNYLQPATKVQRTLLLRDKLITQGEKRETSTQNYQQNNVARHVEGFSILFCYLYSRVGSGISYFAALNLTSASEPTLSPPANKKESKQYLQYLNT